MAVKSILGQALFERKPDLPDLPPLYLEEEQKKAIAANTAALPELQELGSRINQFSQSERLKSLRNVLPDLDKQIGLSSAGITDLLQGKIPKDIQDRVQNMIAGQTLGRVGTSLFDSGQGVNALRDAYGLTSLDLFSKGLSSFNSWLAQGSQYLTGPQYDVTSAFISPMQQAQFDIQERETRFNYNWFKAQHDAQPEPWEKAVEGLLDWVANTGLSVASAYMGNVGGMFGGMGGGQPAMDPNTGYGVG